jgi:cell division septal protein FtsQ
LLALYLLLVHLPYFNLRHVEITGNRRLSRAEIIEVSEIHEGVNLLTMDLNAVAEKLRRHPWVRSVSVFRKFPGEMVIEVQERTPRGILAAGKLYFVDENGEPFTRLFPGDSVDYPLLTGVSADELKAHAGEIQELTTDAFNLLDAMERLGVEIDPAGISEVRLSLDEGLSVYARSGRLVEFGKGEFDLKLQRYGRLKKFLTQRGEWNNARIINLDFEDRALVRSDRTRLQG